ncbi:hypothetical protein Syun_009000 [Stephania yunnanensis]|uniref:Uncharacterized protein n=1 Tax=Stephania yunnanensis TaxID=152371 RepID=A0AAP0KDM4_9MAGN
MIPETQSRRSQRRPAAAKETARIRPAAAARCPMNGSAVAEEWGGCSPQRRALAEQWRAAASLAEQGRGGARRGGARQGRGVQGRGAQRRGAPSRAGAGGGARTGAALAQDRMQRRGTCPAVVAEGLRRWWRVGSENGFGGEMGLER